MENITADPAVRSDLELGMSPVSAGAVQSHLTAAEVAAKAGDHAIAADRLVYALNAAIYAPGGRRPALTNAIRAAITAEQGLARQAR